MVLPGLGSLIAILIVIGGLAFNIGNIAGAGMGFNALLGLDTRIGAIIAGVLAIIIFSSKKWNESNGCCDTITRDYIVSHYRNCDD